ncbi:IPT/TIG domain-containing protein, partial [Vibrio mimicus]
DPFVDDLVAVKLDTQFKIELVKELTLSSLNPDSGAWGDIITISGAGFSRTISDNRIYFTNEDGNAIGTMITKVSPTEITVVVPHGTASGSVWAEVINVNGTQRSNELPFTLEQQMYTFTFGDNGSANDDTYALYVNGQLIRTMASPSRAVKADVQLSAGIHQVELHGITAPDSVGTYYISFPQGITLISGDSMSGYDLTAGRVKRYSVEVQPVSPAQSRMKSSVIDESSVQILWKE